MFLFFVVAWLRKNWFNRLRSEAPNKLQALQAEGLTGCVQPR